MHSYLGITCHFITSEWEMKSLLLSCSKLQGRHTGEKIVSEFEEVVSGYGICNKIVAIVTNNASNMKRGFKDLQESLSLPGYNGSSEESDDSEVDFMYSYAVLLQLITSSQVSPTSYVLYL